MAKNIIIRRNKNGVIFSVESPLRYAGTYTEEEVLQRISEINTKLSNSASRYEIIQVDDLTGQIIEFLLGDGKYKRQHDISDIYLSLEQIYGTAQMLRNELNDISDGIDEFNDRFVSVREKIAEMINELDEK